jgi:hypothetical protein
MTNAERIAKWRAKHARRVARRTPYVPTPFTIDQWVDNLVPGPDEFTFSVED